MALAAPALVVLGAVAAWQFSAADAAPAVPGRSAGPSTVAASTVAARTVAARTGSAATAAFVPTASSQEAALPLPARFPWGDLPPTDRPAAGSRRSAGPVHAASHRGFAPRSHADQRGSSAVKPRPRPRPAGHRAESRPHVAATFTCTGNDPAGMLPANYGSIVTFLAAHGYTPMAAAGMAGNMYQESGGNPESVGTGGGGLIGFTPLPAGYVTGNPAVDLQTQLQAVLAYNQQWAEFIPALNAATSPVQAADVYMNDFERPGLPAASNRENAAIAVAQACGIAG
jgi:Phage tail lysozyme